MMKTMKRNRFLVVLLSVVMVIGVIPTLPLTAYAEPPAPSAGKILYYNFVDYASTIINDASGNGQAAVMQNYDKGGFSIVDDNIYGEPVKALDLPGGADGGYLQFPSGILGTGNAVTISMWVKLYTDTAYQRIWDFGNNTTSYMYLLSDGYNSGAEGFATAITTNGWQSEEAVQKEPVTSNIAKNQWVLTTVVLDGKTLKLYENGVKIGEKTTAIGLAELGATTQNYIGYGQFEGDPKTKGRFAEVNIYNYALSDADIASMYIVDDSAKIDDDVKNLSLGDLSALTAGITLPTKGANGSDISWQSNNAAITIAGNAAQVVRPTAGQSNVSAKLTATIKLGSLERTKEFDATVLAELSNKQIAEADAAALDLGSTDALYRNIFLPLTGESGSVIVWDSSDESTISTEGKVTRPAAGSGDKAVTLTATIRYGNYWLNKQFDCKVIQKTEVAKIVSVAPVSAKTKVGYAPVLPNYVEATYSDGTKANIDTIWPATITASQYAQTGTFTVDGKLIGEDFPITAAVTVESDLTEEHILSAGLFDLNDVTLDDASTRIKQNEGRAIEYLKVLDNDRMLYNFRRTFGQDTKGAQSIGGWDEYTGLLRGHSTGHYLSAMALAYASTGDESIKVKLDYMIHEMRELQKLSKGSAAAFTTKGTPTSAAQSLWSTDPNEWGVGFISAYSPDQFALLEQYTPYATIWAPYYTLHKIMAGFIDAYNYTGNEEALAAAKELGKWVYNRLSACTQPQLTRMWGMYIAGEFGGFNESMATLYEITGDVDFLNGAKLFDNTIFFDNLDKNIDDIAGRHANQHIPQITGALKIYEGTVDQGTPENYYFNVATNFWHMVVSRYAYSIGGVGTGERFQQPYEQAANIRGNENCETCAAYNMMKLTKELYKYAPDDPEYMDYYERTMINQIVASQSPESTASAHNRVTYMLPIGPGSTRSYSNDYSSFTCCHGTGMENHVRYQEAAYYHAGDNLYVNLYIPSTLTWADKGVEVVQDNAFPSEKSKLTVNPIAGQTAKSFDMKLRVPYWATEGFVVKVNDVVQYETPTPSSYIELKGINAGDVIDIDMPFAYHLDRTPDKLNGTDVASVMYGPLVMVARDSSTTMKTLNFTTNIADSITKTTTSAMPTFTTNGLNFAPMYAAYNYAYHTYFKVIVSEEDPVEQYDVYLTNQTTAAGTFTIDKERVVKGESVKITAVPNEGYKVSTLTINGKGVTMRADNTYTVRDVSEALQIVGAFGLTNPPMPDMTELDQWAKPSAHYTASWENVNKINDKTNNPTTSAARTNNGWGNWSQATNFVAWIAYTWDSEVTMNTFDIYWYDDNGGTRVPRAMRIEYWDAGTQTWKETPMTSTFADVNKINQYNTIKFDPVTTSQIRLQLTHQAAGTGILRWKVSCTPDKEVLTSVTANAKTVVRAAYTNASFTPFRAAIVFADSIIADDEATDEDILSAIQLLYSAKQGLIPTTDTLGAAIAEAESVVTEGYTATSVARLAEEIANAKAVKALASPTVAQVDAAIADLDTAVKGLKADKSALKELLTTARTKDREMYTTGWAAFEAQYLEAERVYADNDATKDDVTSIISALTAAMNGLGFSSNITDLKFNVDIYKSRMAALEDTVLSPAWTKYKAALDAAEAIIANPTSYNQAQVNAALAAYLEAVSELQAPENTADTLMLEIAIDEAEALIDDADLYVVSAIAALKEALANAKTVLDERQSNDALSAASDGLWNAIWEVLPRAGEDELANLSILINYADKLNSSSFTTDSWAEVSRYLALAKKVIELSLIYDASDSIVEQVFDALYDALDGLVVKVTLNYGSLDSSITRAQAIITNSDKYIASTIVGLPAAIVAAQTARTDATTQAEINAAATALAKEIAKARVKADLSDLQSLLGNINGLNLSLYTEESAAQVSALVLQAQKLTTSSTQESVNKIVADLAAALNALAALPGTNAPGLEAVPGVSAENLFRAEVQAGVQNQIDDVTAAAEQEGSLDILSDSLDTNDIAAADTPLAAGDANRGAQSQLALILVIILAAMLTVLLTLIYRRRRA